jgi:hypothetical protein
MLSSATRTALAPQGSERLANREQLEGHLTFCVDSDLEGESENGSDDTRLQSVLGRRKEAARFRNIQDSSQGLMLGTVFLDVHSDTRISREVCGFRFCGTHVLQM